MANSHNVTEKPPPPQISFSLFDKSVHFNMTTNAFFLILTAEEGRQTFQTQEHEEGQGWQGLLLWEAKGQEEEEGQGQEGPLPGQEGKEEKEA